MARPALRWLILVPILAVVTCGLLGLSIYVDRYVHRDLIEQVDAELLRAEQTGLARLTPPGAPGLPDRPPAQARSTLSAVDGPVELLVASDGRLLEQTGEENPFTDVELATLASGAPGTYTFGDGEYRVRTIPLRDATIGVTALNLTNVDAVMSNLRRALIAGSAVVLALQAVIVWFIASYLARPLTQMTDSARRIARGELDTTIGEPAGSRETAALATDLDQMLYQLRSTIEQSELSAEEARRARAQMERFLADASHELRTPLTALRGYADLYRGGMLQSPEDLDRAMSRVGSESERMTRLVNDMLRLTRTGAFAEAELASLDVNTVLKNVIADLKAAYPDAIIEREGASDDPLMLLGDADQLHQALLNIAANARHHSPAGTPISFDVARHAGAATVRVIDHGPGVNPELADKIFLPFFQADVSRVRDGDAGAGLGLAISKRIVDAHGGSISVDPTPGGGATFVVRLPLAAVDALGSSDGTLEQDSPLVVGDG